MCVCVCVWVFEPFVRVLNRSVLAFNAYRILCHLRHSRRNIPRYARPHWLWRPGWLPTVRPGRRGCPGLWLMLCALSCLWILPNFAKLLTNLLANWRQFSKQRQPRSCTCVDWPCLIITFDWYRMVSQKGKILTYRYICFAVNYRSDAMVTLKLGLVRWRKLLFVSSSEVSVVFSD